jgi:hypothetical protein
MKMNSKRKTIDIIRSSLKANYTSSENVLFKPDWNEILIMHISRERERKLKKRKLVRAVSTVTALIVMTFLSLIFLTSLDEIKAGNFNIYDAIRDLGKTIDITDIYYESQAIEMGKKEFSQYDKYSEFLLEHPLTTYYKGSFAEIGYEVESIQLAEYYEGKTIYSIFKNEITKNMFSISGFIKNPKVDTSTHTVYPSSEHSIREVDGIMVDFYEAEFGDFAIFTKDGIEFTMEYYKLPNEHIDYIISGLRVYGK